MPSLARDIRRTLLVKFLLLILLWVVCFRGAEKPAVDGPSWLLNHNTPTEVSFHDSRH